MTVCVVTANRVRGSLVKGSLVRAMRRLSSGHR